jgi:hypothetical protein
MPSQTAGRQKDTFSLETTAKPVAQLAFIDKTVLFEKFWTLTANAPVFPKLLQLQRTQPSSS